MYNSTQYAVYCYVYVTNTESPSIWQLYMALSPATHHTTTWYSVQIQSSRWGLIADIGNFTTARGSLSCLTADSTPAITGDLSYSHLHPITLMTTSPTFTDLNGSYHQNNYLFSYIYKHVIYKYLFICFCHNYTMANVNMLIVYISASWIRNWTEVTDSLHMAYSNFFLHSYVYNSSKLELLKSILIFVTK